MTQPDNVPLQATDRVRPSALLPPPGSWYLDRPAEQVKLEPPSGPRFGSTGPDMGYGLKLARRMEHQLVVTPGENLEDVLTGCFVCGSHRAAHFGRAPVIYDMQWAYGLWGYLTEAPADLVAWRKPLFRAAAEGYWAQRQIVDAVRPETLKLNPAQVTEKLSAWKDLLIA